MSLPEHDELIDYLLGRLSPADAEALEERMRSDAELAQTCEELRRELDAVDRRRAPFRGLFSRFSKNKRVSEPESEPSSGSSQNLPEEPAASEETGASASDGAVKSKRPRRPRRFEFIPKFVQAPARSAKQPRLVYKRAVVLSPEETVRYRLRAKLSSSHTVGDYTFSLPSIVSGLAASAFAKPPRSERTFRVSEEFASAEPSCRTNGLDSFLGTVQVTKTFSANRKRVVSIASPLAFERAANWKQIGLLDRSEALNILGRVPSSQGYYASTAVLVDRNELSKSNVFGDYRILPLEYCAGRASYRAEEKPIAASLVEEKPIAASLAEEKPIAARGVEEKPAAVSPSVFPAAAPSTIIPRRPVEIFSVEQDAEDREAGPTLSAEDRYLIELLGREPTAIERAEYYWEDATEEEIAAEPQSKAGSVLNAFITAITEPPVLVGRATIRLARACFPRGVDQGADKPKRQGAEKTRFSDMIISTVAGLLIAAVFIFPFIRSWTDSIYMMVIQHHVHRIGANVTSIQQETAAGLLPVMHDVLFPHYSEADVLESHGGAVHSVDGLPSGSE
ncbi:MAG: hypothetical protein II486_12650 [Thermoguttaceae bacterium]|nr:hypothetical protein [Thermoguttaceae bacterium]